MILDDMEPIDLSLLVDLLGQIDRSAPYPDGRAIDHAVQAAITGIAHHSTRQNEVRRAICWLLDRDDSVLNDLLSQVSEVLRSEGVVEQRRLLVTIWDRLFADWRVEGFDPADYEVIGVPGGE